MENIEQQKVMNMNKIFDSRFLDSNNLYIHHFNEVPSLHFRNKIDGEKAFEAVREKYSQRIVTVYQYRWFNYEKKKVQFDTTIVIFDNHCLMEFNSYWYKILHNNSQAIFLEEMDQLISQFREKQKRQPREMNLIIRTSGGFELKSMEIKKTRLDLDLFYEDDFRDTDELIRKRLRQKKDKGIVLLHGLPGTGKTTYLRHLIGRIKKKILFISPTVASGLLNP